MAIEQRPPSLIQRAAASFARAVGYEVAVAKAAAPKTTPPYATAIRASGLPVGAPKRGAKMLRSFSMNNEWVRAAINRRKNALAYAKYSIVRRNDTKQQGPDPRVIAEVDALLRTVNPSGESFHTLLKKIIEDVLVLDAGCIEKVTTIGGDLAQLWPVDGATIEVDPEWERDCNPNAPRYRQYENFNLIATLRNDQLVYVQHNPATYRPIGWSPVETLVRVIEAELYAEQYDFDSLKENMPDVVMDLGPGVDDKELEQLRGYYEAEIAGTRNVFFYGGGPDDPNYKGLNVIPITRSGDSVQREAYKKYMATKIAAVFEISPESLGLLENSNRSTSKTGQEQTDVGLVGLARTIEEYVTREIIWAIDENHSFAFDGIVPRDELSQAKIDQIYMQIGVTFPNEVRAREGRAPVEWGDEPYNAQGSPTPDPLDPDETPADPENDDDPPKSGGSEERKFFRREARESSPNRARENALHAKLEAIVAGERSRLEDEWARRSHALRDTMRAHVASKTKAYDDLTDPEHDFRLVDYNPFGGILSGVLVFVKSADELKSAIAADLDGLDDAMVSDDAYVDAATAGVDAVPRDHGVDAKIDPGELGRAHAQYRRKYAANAQKRIIGVLAAAADEIADDFEGDLAGAYAAINEKLDGMERDVTRYADPPWATGQAGYGNELGANDVLMVWVLEPGAAHCDDCTDLADESASNPWTADEVPTWPGFGDTQCLDQCKCHIEPDAATFEAAFEEAA